MKFETFEKGMNILLKSFPSKEIDIDISWDLLNDIPDQTFLIAIKDVCSTTSELYPGTNVVALIREIALSGVYLLAGEAWQDVLDQIRITGYTGVPKFKDNITEQAVNSLGWKTICQSENISIERSHFLKIYDSFLRREKDKDVKLPEVKKLLEEITKQIGRE